MVNLTSIFAGALILIFFVAIWYAATIWLTPQMKNPDGYARITGNCGDTMEIGLQIQNQIVTATHTWTDGCSISKLCVEAAARLAQGQDISALKQVNMVAIIEELGSLPETHLHCAQLAEITLQKAISSCQEKSQKPAA